MSTQGSQDNTSNAPIGGDPFEDLQAALRANVSDSNHLARLLAAVDDMRALQGQAEFAESYQRFVALSEGHLGVIGPYLATFAGMIK